MPHGKIAFDSVEKLIPQLKSRFPDLKTFLYVGWRHDCHPWWHDTFAKQLGAETTVLDIFPKNISELNDQVNKGRYKVSAVVGDVRKLEELFPLEKFDLIFWDHGPEHVNEQDLISTTHMLKSHARCALIYCCPWGRWSQGPSDGNEHERHQTSVTPEMLQALGLTVQKFGDSGQEHVGELVGVFYR